MKKILVTGGAGFLGSHLCDRLEELFGQKAKIINSLWWLKKPLEGNFNTDMYSQLDTPNE